MLLSQEYLFGGLLLIVLFCQIPSTEAYPTDDERTLAYLVEGGDLKGFASHCYRNTRFIAM
jgi:hypothetical protein